MELLLNFIFGTVVVPLFQLFKRRLGLADGRAIWVLLPILLLLAVPVAMASGALAGLTFSLADPFAFLEASARAFLVLLGTSQGWYLSYFKGRMGGNTAAADVHRDKPTAKQTKSNTKAVTKR